jgi:HK97 family phage prohead protease
MDKKIEIRSIAEVPVAGEGRTISGYAIVFGVESRVLWDWDGEFVEIIERGAVDETLINSSDVKALFNHDKSYLLARSVNGEGTLRLSLDDHGLRFEFEAPETTAGNDVLELVRRGDLRGCSFAFTAAAEDIEYSKNGEERLRRVKRINGLYDVSVVVDPAYTQTSVDARSFEPQEDPKPAEEGEKREGRSLDEVKRVLKTLV